MNIALIFQQRVLAYASQQIGQWLAATPTTRRDMPEKSNAPKFATDFVAARAQSVGATRLNLHNSAVRPLRVVRVVDAGQSQSGVGRMVISGRMADVCAELDRLAAREAALT